MRGCNGCYVSAWQDLNVKIVQHWCFCAKYSYNLKIYTGHSSGAYWIDFFFLFRFSSIAFWVRILNVPLKYMSMEMEKFIRGMLGVAASGCWTLWTYGDYIGQCLGIRVSSNISKPIQPGLLVRFHTKEDPMCSLLCMNACRISVIFVVILNI